LHILDPAHHRVATKEQVDGLIKKIILPPELADPFGDDEHFDSDRIAQLEATAVLFPLVVRNELYAMYMAGKITLPSVADALELPVEYATTVMSGFWPAVHKSLIDRRRRFEVETSLVAKRKRTRSR
jgi:hypothetical protein